MHYNKNTFSQCIISQVQLFPSLLSSSSNQHVQFYCNLALVPTEMLPLVLPTYSPEYHMNDKVRDFTKVCANA